LIAPLALIAGLALAGGGFDLSARHIAGLAVWLAVAGLLALGAGARASLGKPFYWASGLILGLALLSAISSLWSGSIELSVTEADRVLVYLGIFLAAFLIAQTDQRRQRFAEGIAIALALIAVAALATRLLPDVFDAGPGLGSGPRLRYPLGYWNANGLAFGIGVTMALWMSRRSLSASLRWLAVASLPVLLLALYFTYSRGGLLALLVAAGVLLALSHDRLWLLGTLAIGALGALPALLAVQARPSLADNSNSPVTVDQGLEVALLLAAGVALALALFAGLRWLEGRDGRKTGRALALSRSPGLLKGVAFGAALLAIAVAIAVGGRAWDQFSSSDLQFPNQPGKHFGELSGAGRHDFYRVAIDAFEEKPALGHGAGTYEFSWDQLRSISIPVKDAHSVFFEAFAELGLAGGLLVLALFGVLLWTGFAAWRDARGSQQELCAVLLAVLVAFTVGFAIDWFWEIGGLAAVFFLASGVLVAVRCTQLAPLRSEAGGRGEGRRFGLAVAGLAVAWVTALGLIGPLLVDHEIKASQAAAADGDIAGAVNHADTARSIEPWAATPYVQLGLLAQVQGDYVTAAGRLSQAINREDRSWLLYYLRSKIEHEAGDGASARADLRRAQQLNPLESCLREGWDGCG
jgi:O-Antigen ligase